MIEYTGHFEIKVTGKHSCKEVLAFADKRYNELNEQVLVAKRAIKNKVKYCKRQQNIIDIANEIEGANNYPVLRELCAKYRHRFRSLSWRFNQYERQIKNPEEIDDKTFLAVRKEVTSNVSYEKNHAKTKIDNYTKRASEAREQLPHLEELLGEFKKAKDLNDLLFKED